MSAKKLNSISLSDLKKKCNSKEKISQLFSLTSKHKYLNLSLYLPPNPCFDFSFCVQVLKKEKKVIYSYNFQLLKHSPNPIYALPYFRTYNLLTLEDLQKRISNSKAVLDYLPNNPKIEQIDRDLLFTIIHDADLPLYTELNKLAENMKDYRNEKLFSEFSIEVEEEFQTALGKKPALKGKIYIK